MSDRTGAPVAHPSQMAKGTVPIELPWAIVQDRLSPWQAEETPWAGEWTEPDTSRCHNNAAAAAAFTEAVQADTAIGGDEKAGLAAARERLKQGCSDAAKVNVQVEPARTPSAQAFAAYLVGAQQFYAGNFAAASSAFRPLAGASQPWVRDTASYMLARTALNHAQQSSFDEYGDLARLDERDLPAIDAAGAALDHYLKANPRGRYVQSAAGLQRRVAWLRGDTRTMGAAYSALVGGAAKSDHGDADLGLIAELDRKLLPTGTVVGVTDPTLLAVIDLMRLRQDGRENDYDWDYRGARLERAELEAQRPIFRSDPDLFGYLLAVEAYYQRKQPKEVLALIPDAAKQQRFSYVQFSRQMLRGFALEAVKDPNARGFWLSLLPGAVQPYQRGAVELALAEHDRMAGRIDPLFAANSPVRHPLVRQKLLEEGASAALLRQQAKGAPTAREREVSLYILLANELHYGRYADFLRDLSLVGNRAAPAADTYYGSWDVRSYDPKYNDELGPPPLHVFAATGSSDIAPCPPIAETASSLAASPAAIRPRLCLAEFFRRKGFDGWNQVYNAEYQPVQRNNNGFTGKPIERIDIYRSVMTSAAASPDDKAFALNRAIRCFAPTGSSSCGGNDIPVEQRRAWFTQLKRDYPQSPWARDLKVYW